MRCSNRKPASVKAVSRKEIVGPKISGTPLSIECDSPSTAANSLFDHLVINSGCDRINLSWVGAFRDPRLRGRLGRRCRAMSVTEGAVPQRGEAQLFGKASAM